MDLERRWPDLLPDLLCQISGRLHHAADFVRFHAVCRSWRDSHDGMVTATTQSFMPWLLAPDPKNHEDLSWLTCVFSKRSYRAPPLPFSPKWVAKTDGTDVRYLVDNHPRSSLHDPLTGAVALVPAILDPDDKSWEHSAPKGLIYRDGTILLYCQWGINYSNPPRFRAALLRPRDAAWTVVERTIGDFEWYNMSCFAYHGGKVMLSVRDSYWHMVTPSDDFAKDMLVPRTWMPTVPNDYYYHSSHVLESRGKVLYASLHVKMNNRVKRREDVCRLVQVLSLSVYTFQEEMSVPQKVQHVMKDGQSLADRVLFLGCPNSFALDASRLACEGGCAYFLYSGGEGTSHDWSGVFKYDIADNKAEFVEWLPEGWRDDTFTWIIPQLNIAPVLTSVPHNASKMPSISVHKIKV